MSNAQRRTFVITGATGSVGRAASARLEAMGHKVRPVARRSGVSFDDPGALDRAFEGVDGAYIMIPFDYAAQDLHGREEEIAEKLVSVLSKRRPRRVVLLSGLVAHHGGGTTGSARGAALMELRLNELLIPELVHLRAGFFMENLLQGIEQMIATGVFASPFSPHRAMPMVAAADVGGRVAELLTEEPFRGPQVQELHGGGDYRMNEAAAMLGRATGKPNVNYLQLDYGEAREAMIKAGLSESFANAVIQTARSFNEGEQWALEARSPRNTTVTTLERFAATLTLPKP
ncbi:NmrA family transcriptional regulator [Bradyrhizobium guangzhouense]|uniref:NmrA family transcriptional regulator n=1 Tax=Bradyrhizobium guangzhouense TaxID=1325095 RepID=A0AAE5X836_9BRAD|nr:NmrA family transcriptional regulator [Bradyrhizobium guangzhouense]QAU50298.1 NmrA family transcriptional regulator [Bradyrhizobium guangzhouense]RXH15029.1 NmrA family transcriptional regulator [Bradyrhizobium guangzhouense]RXH18950.1 NmrA family transcriptional regulator [Bradyrhizobium guangzhouense]